MWQAELGYGLKKHSEFNEAPSLQPFRVGSITMSPTEPNPEDKVARLPDRVISLGEALEPVARELRHTLKRRVRASDHQFVVLADLLRHVEIVERALSHLAPMLEDLQQSVFRNEAAGTLEAYRAAGRLEQVVSEFVVGYREAQATQADSDSAEARRLMLGVYRHHIREICQWLEELVQVIGDPDAAIKRRGISMEGSVDLTVVMNMTSPPEMTELNVLANEMRKRMESMLMTQSSPEFEPVQSYRPGIFGTIGALAFGVGVTKALLVQHPVISFKY